MVHYNLREHTESGNTAIDGKGEQVLDDRERLRSFVVRELAQSQKPATEAAIDWIVSAAEERKRQEQTHRHEMQLLGIGGLVAGVALGWAFSDRPGYLIGLAVGAAIIFGILKYARSALATVGWLGVAGFIVGMGGWVWMLHCLADKERFSLLEMILPTIGMWAVGMFMFAKGSDRRKQRASATDAQQLQ